MRDVKTIILEPDESIFAECFINKVFGIVLLFVLLGKLHMTWRDIGFHREKLIKDCLKGFGLCAFFSTSVPVQSGSDLQTTSSCCN